MPHIQYIHAYEDIISLDNLLGAWKEFVRGKRGRSDVQDFQLHLFDNLDSLHEDLEKKIYQHGGYESFKVNDPKPRDIHKACVRDRVLHRALYRTLYPFFDCLFTTDSFSCRNDKGTHKAMDRFKAFGYKASRNRTCTAWVLKGDIRKFFASIDHGVLLDILSHYILDDDIIWLINEIVSSFNSTKAGVGLPLGNLTSQLLTNVYMNEFDQFIKHELKMKYYIRYADDFVVMSNNRDQLAEIIRKLQEYLFDNLKLTIHPDKIYIKTIASGIDYLGWVHFPDHRVLRTTTKRRMFRNLKEKKSKVETVQSYLGLLKHGNAHKLEERIKEISSGKIL